MVEHGKLRYPDKPNRADQRIRRFDTERAIFPDEALTPLQPSSARPKPRPGRSWRPCTGRRPASGCCRRCANGWTPTARCHPAPRLQVLRPTLRIAFFRPAHGLNPELEARYRANRLGMTRQLTSAARTKKSLDVTLSVNGIPVVTLELKNPLSGQTAERHPPVPPRPRPARADLRVQPSARWCISPWIPSRRT
jgi:type I restriction enzyme, R subunit